MGKTVIHVFDIMIASYMINFYNKKCGFTGKDITNIELLVLNSGTAQRLKREMEKRYE